MRSAASSARCAPTVRGGSWKTRLATGLRTGTGLDELRDDAGRIGDESAGHRPVPADAARLAIDLDHARVGGESPAVARAEVAREIHELIQDLLQSFAEESLAKKTVEVPEDQLADPEGFATRYNTGWRVVEVKENKVVIQEDPEFNPFVWVHKFDTPIDGKYGYVVTKSITSGSMVLDDERLTVLDPGFYEEITQWKYPELANAAGGGDEWLDAIGWPRELKPLEDLTKHQFAEVQQYLYELPKSAKLLVRYAKADESAED